MKEKEKKSICYYKQAYKQCDEYFISVKTPEETQRAKMVSHDAAREAFKQKHGESGSISQCILTDEDVAEYVALFQGFLKVYLRYTRG